MQSLIRSKTAGVTGGRGIAGAGPGRDLLYTRKQLRSSSKNPKIESLSEECTGMIKIRDP